MTHIIEHPMPTSAEMRAEIKRKIAAGEPLGASHVQTVLPGVFIAGTLMPNDNPRWPCRKSVRNGSACHGKDVPCMPGHGGKCTACYNDD